MRLDGDDTERNFIAMTGGEIARFCVAMLILSKTMSKVGRSDSHTGRGRILTQCGLLGGGSAFPSPRRCGAHHADASTSAKSASEAKPYLVQIACAERMTFAPSAFVLMTWT